MINAYAAKEKGGKFEPYEYDPGALGDHEVKIEVHSCGICHSDLSMWQNEWGMTQYPFVGGHEVAGKVLNKGKHVKHLELGDKVGLGWHKGYCNVCDLCIDGDHNLCLEQEGTIIGNHGGFADKVRAKDTSVIKIPEGLDFNAVGPLLCGGVTVFNPLMQYDIKPTSKVAVIGIGGLGHLALQFANAWGCEVTAFTSESKMEEAKEMGAHHSLNSRDDSEIEKAAGSFDLIISTVNVDMNWDVVIKTLRPKGKLHFVGLLEAPLEISAAPMIMAQNSLSGSPVGSPATLRKMLDFAARHNIQPVTETYTMSEINEAFERLESGNARYRVVLERD